MKFVNNPRQVILVTSRGEAQIMGKKQARDNIITIAWHTPLSFEPEMYAIVVGKERFSYDLLKSSGIFAVNFMEMDYLDQVVFCGKNSGEHIDKFEKTKFTKVECDKIECSRIKEAIAYMECEIIEEREVGDHILLISKVLKSEGSIGKRIFQTGFDKYGTVNS